MTTRSSPRPGARARERWSGERLRRIDDSNPLIPYLYLLPHAALFAVFIVYPVGYGVYVSLHRWDVLMPVQRFVGLEFYANLLNPATPQSQFFWRTLLNTGFFVAVSVPLLVGVALGLALLLDRPIFGRAFFRAVFFLPTILSVSVVGLLWFWTLNNQGGLVNVILTEYLWLRPIRFLTEQPWAWTGIVVATVWWTVGFNMTLYIAALQAIPRTYYEAAELDGAGSWAKLRWVTWPLLTPTTLFVLVTTALASWQLFGQSQIITQGGPSRTTQSVIMYITEEAFSNYQMSSAAAMSIIFGAIMLLFTALQFRIMAREVR
jgi:multiple sugar transport system permease protein